LIFQSFDMLADSRLRNKQHLRRLRETQIGSYFHEYAMSEGDHGAKLVDWVD